MPAIKPQKKPPRAKSSPSTNGTTTATGPVLTLTETAEYLRVDESAVLELVTQQGLPGRLVGRNGDS